jgi:arsenite methyltransferase
MIFIDDWDMIELALRNLEKFNASNISIVEALITSIPLSSETADCIISNYVINLVPEIDKPKVFYEIFRLLKLGGRVAISGLVAKKELPFDMRHNIALPNCSRK